MFILSCHCPHAYSYTIHTQVNSFSDPEDRAFIDDSADGALDGALDGIEQAMTDALEVEVGPGEPGYFDFSPLLRSSTCPNVLEEDEDGEPIICGDVCEENQQMCYYCLTK